MKDDGGEIAVIIRDQREYLMRMMRSITDDKR